MRQKVEPSMKFNQQSAASFYSLLLFLLVFCLAFVLAARSEMVFVAAADAACSCCGKQPQIYVSPACFVLIRRAFFVPVQA